MASSGGNPSRLRQSLTCLSIAANSLVAGGVFVFPVLSPALASILKLSQPQLTTVGLVGIIGQYPFAPIVGKILDLYGPSTCSLISAALFFLAFMSSSSLVAMAPVDITQPAPWSFHWLTLFFFLAGLGTVFSYFSSIFAASKSFPRHPGAAAGISMALFGLSPLCLSLFASHCFTEASSGQLKIVPYLRFLASLTAFTHILGAFILNPPEPLISAEAEVAQADETTRLVPTKHSDELLKANYPDPIRDPYFWVLALYCFLSIGASEMVISNMGTIVLSLPPSSDDTISTPPDVVTADQVKIISASNTLSRLLVGPLADFVSPVASFLPTGMFVYSGKHRVSRVVFLSGPILLLGLAFLWMEIKVRSREAVWVLSIATGINYGAVFTILPSIVSSGWGPPNLGRNFGFLTYAPFIGTPLFSYLYAFVSAANTRDATGISASVMAFGFSSLDKLMINASIGTQYGGHFQFLTIQGLVIALLTMVVSLLLDLFPSSQVLRKCKRALFIVAMPLSVVISTIYWTLLLLFPTLILPPQPSGSTPTASADLLLYLPLEIDLALHATPALTLLADFILFETSYSKRSLITTAPLAALLFGVWYSCWVEHCARSNGGIFPYPFLTENPIEIRLAIYAGACTLAYASFWAINSLHPRARLRSKISPSVLWE
ncbi:putative MFS general substrate transporter [Lyophyllum shimeji]|uniref:MFS general substrate transporter n=1 Tax=Lyophyllum shimeji TaxID=47721 RepID=A0A9P3PGK1_LYOSH|nr:putative MFS general substrate transporter [Lyophyllum shimeji]